MSTPSPPFPVLILYGSQTGNSESIAKDLQISLSNLLPTHAPHITAQSMADYIKQDDTLARLPSHRLLLCLLSTTGQGDAPDTAGKFLRVVRRHLTDTQWLSNCQYNVLALGDTNYSNFCKPGIRLDGELVKMGGKRWLPLACADDGTSLEDVVEPWKEKVKAKLTAEAATSNTATEAASQDITTTSATTAAPTSATSATSALSTSSFSSSSGSSPNSSTSADSSSGQFKQSATAAAIQQAQQAMRAMQLVRSTGIQQPLAISSIGHTASPSPSTTSPPPSGPSPLLALPPSLILYATQTGNSEAVARELHTLYSAHFTPPPTLLSMPQYLATHSATLSTLPSLYPLVTFVCSSTADGQPPDNALRFLRLLKKESDSSGVSWMSGVQYVVLGLGDSTYDHFGGGSTRVEREVARGGGVRLMERWVADESKGLQKQVEAWKKRWVERLEQLAKEWADSESEKVSSTQPAIALPSPLSAQSVPGDSTVEGQQKSATVGEMVAKVHDDEESKESPGHVSVPSTALPPLSTDTRDTSELDDDPAINRPKVKIPKPLGLARFHPIRLSVHTSPPAPASPSAAVPSSYFDRRWQNVDTEAVLKGYTPDAPFFATLSTAHYLTTPLCHQQGRRVVHVELSLPWEGREAVLYTPGDSIGVYTVNDRQVVVQLVERLGLQLADVVEVKMRELTESAPQQEKPAVDHKSGEVRRIKAVASVHPAAPDPVSRLASSSSPLPQPPLPFSFSPAPVLAHISTPCTVSDVFTYCVDITAQPKKALLRLLAEYCHSADDKTRLYQLASPLGKKEYDALIASHSHSLLSLLTTFPSCKPPLAGLLDHLPPLQPRYYSITSSPLTHPTSIHIAYTIVEQGVCTPWLTQLCQSTGHLLDDPYRARPNQPLLGAKQESSGLLLPVFMRRTATFTLPVSLSVPLLFVGPGTGVAPFRSFLLHRRCQRLALASGGVAMGWWRGMEVDMEEEMMKEEDDEVKELSGRHTRITTRPPVRPPRAASAVPVLASSPSTADTADGERTAVGETLLFFGCRAAELDMLYQSDFDSLLADSTLTTLHTAFSRPLDGSGGCYVQQRLREQAERVWRLLESGGMFFVCGDGGAMAKGVMAAVVDVYRQCGGLSEKEATERVAGLMREKRYVQDIWS